MNSGKIQVAPLPRERCNRVSKMTKMKLAKVGFLTAAGASFLLSVFLWFSGRKDEGLFVGLWVPSILSFGALVLAGKSHER
jgi:hypothetical protein